MSTPARRVRLAGSRWRLLAWRWVGPGAREDGCAYDLSYEVTSDRRARGKGHEVTALPGTEFDELVVGKWLHIEQLSPGLWWMNIGGLVVHVKADRDGRPTRVTVDELDEVPGCSYEFRMDQP